MSQSPDRSAEAMEHKMRDLDRTISRIERKIGYTRPKQLPITLIVAVVTPIVVAAILYMAQPKFVLTETDIEPVRDTAKLAKWTLLFTAAIYAALYGVYFVMNRPKKSAAS